MRDLLIHEHLNLFNEVVSGHISTAVTRGQIGHVLVHERLSLFVHGGDEVVPVRVSTKGTLGEMDDLRSGRRLNVLVHHVDVGVVPAQVSSEEASSQTSNLLVDVALSLFNHDNGDD